MKEYLAQAARSTGPPFTSNVLLYMARKLSFATGSHEAKMVTEVKNALPSFRQPPINEVVFGCQFEQLSQFKITHYGVLWERLRKEFPNVEHALPIARADGAPPDDAETNLPWFRTWFINETDTRLIQFQPDRFYYNWRKRDGELQYPRYPELFTCFERYYGALKKFVAENGLGLFAPKIWELTYTNHIPINDDSGAITNPFRDLYWKHDPDRFLPEPENPAWAATFILPDGAGTLVAKLTNGRVEGTADRIRVLELAARGEVQDNSEEAMKAWFEQAREWIVRGFTDLTTDEAHKIWEREA